MKNFSNSLNGYHDGSVAKPTSGNAEFDNQMNSNFAKLIADAKKRKQKQNTGEDVSDGADDVNNNNGGALQDNGMVGSFNQNGHGSGAANYNAAKKSSSSNNDNNDGAVSPTASIDSDKTVETPEKVHPRSSSTTSVAKKQRSSSTKKKKSSAKSTISSQSAMSRTLSTVSSTASSTTSKRNTRVSSLGPWTCSQCTYENLRNTTKKARCEMCDAVRPEIKVTATSSLSRSNSGRGQEVEIVNIDC